MTATLTPMTFAEAAEAVRHFRLFHARFVLKATTPIELPPYKGSAFRGGFGHALKRISCQAPEGVCEGCRFPEQCAYRYLFETQIGNPGQSEEALPRPFVLVPPLEAYLHYTPGDLLTCDVRLVGDAVDYLPFFIAGMDELGRQGLGRERGRYGLVQVQGVPFQRPVYEIYAGTDERLIGDVRPATTGEELVSAYHGLTPHELTLTFITPTRLKFQGHLVKSAPPFHVVFKRLIDRIAELSFFFHGVSLDLDLRAWKRLSEQVHTVHSQVVPYDWERYSNRQRTRMKLGGVVGTATYAGGLTPFLPLLALGEWLHVGKGATFGLGAYRIDWLG